MLFHFPRSEKHNNANAMQHIPMNMYTEDSSIISIKVDILSSNGTVEPVMEDGLVTCTACRGDSRVQIATAVHDCQYPAKRRNIPACSCYIVM